MQGKPRILEILSVPFRMMGRPNAGARTIGIAGSAKLAHGWIAMSSPDDLLDAKAVCSVALKRKQSQAYVNAWLGG